MDFLKAFKIKKIRAIRKVIPPKKYAEIKRLCGSELFKKIIRVFKFGLNRSMLTKKSNDLCLSSLNKLK